MRRPPVHAVARAALASLLRQQLGEEAAAKVDTEALDAFLQVLGKLGDEEALRLLRRVPRLFFAQSLDMTLDVADVFMSLFNSSAGAAACSSRAHQLQPLSPGQFITKKRSRTVGSRLDRVQVVSASAQASAAAGCLS